MKVQSALNRIVYDWYPMHHYTMDSDFSWSNLSPIKLIRLTFNKKVHFFGDRFQPIIIPGDTLVCSGLMPCDWPQDNISTSHLQRAWKVYCYKCSTPRDTNQHSGPDGILPPFFLQTSLGWGWPSRTRQRKLTSSPSLTVKLSFGSMSIVGLTEI